MYKLNVFEIKGKKRFFASQIFSHFYQKVYLIIHQNDRLDENYS